MTINLPTDGFGVYESKNPSDPTSLTRLDQIAAGGFKLVLNYTLMYASSIADVITYINRAHTNGMKVIITLNAGYIWDLAAYPSYTNLQSSFPALYAAAGSPTTNWDQTFSQYIVNQTKGLAGTWGYYIGDEVVASQHANMLNHAAYILAADNTHPRMIIEGGGGTCCCAPSQPSYASIFNDCCDVIGDDYYPIGEDYAAYTLTTAQTAQGIQSYCNTYGLGSVMTLQTFDWTNYGHPIGQWPTEAQMLQMRNDCLSNMTPRIVMWYSYFDAVGASAPAKQWLYVQQATAGIANIPYSLDTPSLVSTPWSF